MKILKGNAGALTNFEVLDFLRSRGASRDPTRVIAPIARSEYKVYDYLVETAACNQTRECVKEFVEKCKKFELAKAEILNIINIRPSSVVALEAIIEMIDSRGIDAEALVELIKEVLPPLPISPDLEGTSKDKKETSGAEQTENNEDETADAEQMEAS